MLMRISKYSRRFIFKVDTKRLPGVIIWCCMTWTSKTIVNLEVQRCGKKCPNRWLENGKHSSKHVDNSPREY